MSAKVIRLRDAGDLRRLWSRSAGSHNRLVGRRGTLGQRPDVSGVLGQVEQLLDESVAANEYLIPARMIGARRTWRQTTALVERPGNGSYWQTPPGRWRGTAEPRAGRVRE